MKYLKIVVLVISFHNLLISCENDRVVYDEYYNYEQWVNSEFDEDFDNQHIVNKSIFLDSTRTRKKMIYYHENGKIKQIYSTGENGDYVNDYYVYNDNGSLIEYSFYFYDGNLRYQRLYDGKNKIIDFNGILTCYNVTDYLKSKPTDSVIFQIHVAQPPQMKVEVYDIKSNKRLPRVKHLTGDYFEGRFAMEKDKHIRMNCKVLWYDSLTNMTHYKFFEAF